MDQDDVIVLAVVVVLDHLVVGIPPKPVVLKLAVLSLRRNSWVPPGSSVCSGNSMLIRFFPNVPDMALLNMVKYLKASSSGGKTPP